ncbi:MAG TPA: hypothetical protein PLB05_02960 [Candidatus Omnitrophota bacterium]|nr:hypothetical protein [Candidatus Omnitrophota bacterium]
MEKEVYYVEFESWRISAKSLNEACAVVQAKLNKGEFPAIAYIELDKRMPLRKCDL